MICGSADSGTGVLSGDPPRPAYLVSSATSAGSLLKASHGHVCRRGALHEKMSATAS